MNNKEKFSKILYRILKALVLEADKAEKSDDAEGEYENLVMILQDFVHELENNSIEA